MDEILENSFETALSDQRIDELGIDYIVEGISEQLTNIYDPHSVKNYLKRLEQVVLPDKMEEREIKDNICNKIIDSIASIFEIDIDKDSVNSLNKLAKTMYKFFVLEFKANIVYFLEMYILENKKSIYKAIDDENNINTKRIEGIVQNIGLILNNIPNVIEYISEDTVDFDSFLKYISKHVESGSAVTELMEYNEDYFDNADEIFTQVMEHLTSEGDGFSDIYTTLQMNLYERFNTLT